MGAVRRDLVLPRHQRPAGKFHDSADPLGCLWRDRVSVVFGRPLPQGPSCNAPDWNPAAPGTGDGMCATNAHTSDSSSHRRSLPLDGRSVDCGHGVQQNFGTRCATICKEPIRQATGFQGLPRGRRRPGWRREFAIRLAAASRDLTAIVESHVAEPIRPIRIA